VAEYDAGVQIKAPVKGQFVEIITSVSAHIPEREHYPAYRGAIH
jgi:hypothetical protein